MIGMKVRYEMTDVSMKISNVTLPKAEDSYVLLTAYDDDNNEIVFVLSHQQAERLEDELFEANRRRKEHASAAMRPTRTAPDELMLEQDAEQLH